MDEYRDPTELVAAGYDQVAEVYAELATRPNAIKERYTEAILERLAAGSAVLELGCGAGVPTTEILAQRLDVTAVELSRVQVTRARGAVPSARYIRADMSRLALAESSFDAVVAFYSIIHVPRDRQPALMASVFSWLRPGGTFVASLASTGSDVWIEDDYLGARMYWSSFDAETNERLLVEAGFEVESADLVEQTFDGEDETHLWVVARRPPRSKLR